MADCTRYKRILCFGDSNTYGYDARSFWGERFPAEQQWPYILGKMLDAQTINCGINGRTIPRQGRAAEAELAALKRHLPWDLAIVMLGSNDVLNMLYPSAAALASSMKSFLTGLMRLEPDSDVLLISPPKIRLSPKMEKLSEELPECYSAAADELGIYFADADGWGLSFAWDEVHLTPEGHRTFAEKTADFLRTNCKE